MTMTTTTSRTAKSSVSLPITQPMTHGSSAFAIAPVSYPQSMQSRPHTTAQQPLAFDPTWIKAQEERNLARDDAEKSFTNAPALLNFLNDREKNASWIIGSHIGSLRVMLLEDAHTVLNTATQEILIDTRNNTGLCISGEKLPETALRSCALSSLFARARIGGAALGDVSKPVLRNIINECLKVAPKKGVSKIRLAEGKVSAVLSSSYVPLSMPEIFEMAVGYIDKRFPANYFAGGSWSHAISSAEWALSSEEGLLKAYKAALRKHGIKDTNIQPGLRLSSSDIGISGVNLMPKLVVGNDRLLLPLGGPVGLEHKGDASLVKFKENLQGVFAQYGDQLEKLASLLEITIQNPVNCMKLIMKRLAIPKKYAAPVLEIFGIGFGHNGHCTAHDIYYGLGELMMQMQIQKATGEQMLRTEEAIAKALTLNFADYDVPADDDNE